MFTALKEAASMLALFHKRHPPVGARPGTLVVTETDVPPRIHVMCYDRAGLEESDVEDVEILPSLIGGPRLTWIDIPDTEPGQDGHYLCPAGRWGKGC
jgi:hypothetical protein